MLTNSTKYEDRPSSYFVKLRELRIMAKDLPYYGKKKEPKKRSKKTKSKSLVDKFMVSMSPEQQKALLGKVGIKDDSFGT